MPTGTIILLGAFAGLTIYFGLPLAFFKHLPTSLKAFMSMLATGVLIFLLYDVISKASEPITEALSKMRIAPSVGSVPFATDLFLLIFGLILGLVGLVYFNKRFTARLKGPKAARTDGGPAALPSAPLAVATAVAPRVARKETAPHTLALIIATGIGLHNFSEGLAIGQSAASGALQLAVILIIGFGLHNMTEGFGIAGPLTGQATSWKFIGLVGLIGGGPTFLGTLLGTIVQSPQLFIFCLALAAGSILYVIAELLGMAKRFDSQYIVMWGLLAGFLLGYGTDLIVTFAGA